MLYGDTICNPNSSYVATKLYGSSASGCNKYAIMREKVMSIFLSGIGDVCKSGKITTLLLFVFTFLFLSNYRVKHFYYIGKCFSRVACNRCVLLNIALNLALSLHGIYIYVRWLAAASPPRLSLQ